jgi:hypothetical protein
MNMLKVAALSALVCLPAVATQAAPVVDTVQANTGFFTPAGGFETSSPYYRGYGEGWGWTHGAIASGFASASLNISAYDVDYLSGELDTIEAYDAATSSWLLLGSLTGINDAFSFTEFDIFGFGGGSLIDDIVAGLQVRMNIDLNREGWLVSLAKSVITTDGAGAGNPNPSPVPLPAAGWLMIAGLGGLAALRRRRKM